MNVSQELYTEVTQFISCEADMLDHKEYSDWLNLWTDTGMYIVPVDHTNKDYANALNVAYDDAEMRKMRTERLTSGEAVSTHEARTTVRTLSRIRVLDEENGLVRVRAAYCLYESKKGFLREFPADVQFKLARDTQGNLKIQEKIVNVLKSDESLATIAYLF